MKRAIAPLLLALCLTSPATAQETDDEGYSLMERGVEMFLRGLRDEMDPALEGLQEFALEMGPSLRQFVQEMGPALSDLADQVKDWSVYHPPEILPNGDIILRKRTPEENLPAPPVVPESDDAIDL